MKHGANIRKRNKIVTVFLMVFSLLILPVPMVQAQQITDEAVESLTKEQADQIVNYIIGKIASGALDSEEAVRAAIAEGEAELQITLTEEEKESIVKLVNTINSWELDTEALAEKAKELYAEYGGELLENPEQVLADVAQDSADSFFQGIGNFFVDLGNDVKTFFQNGIERIFRIF